MGDGEGLFSPPTGYKEPRLQSRRRRNLGIRDRGRAPVHRRGRLPGPSAGSARRRSEQRRPGRRPRAPGATADQRPVLRPRGGRRGAGERAGAGRGSGTARGARRGLTPRGTTTIVEKVIAGTGARLEPKRKGLPGRTNASNGLPPRR